MQERAEQFRHDVMAWFRFAKPDVSSPVTPRKYDLDFADLLSSQMMQGQLFTELAARAANDSLSARVVRGEGELTPSESDWLKTDVEMHGLTRRGELRTKRTGKLVARITSVFLPDRIRNANVVELLAATDIPLGLALNQMGVRREMLWLWRNPDEDHVIYSCARLLLPVGTRNEWPVAVATERILPPEKWVS